MTPWCHPVTRWEGIWREKGHQYSMIYSTNERARLYNCEKRLSGNAAWSLSGDLSTDYIIHTHTQGNMSASLFSLLGRSLYDNGLAEAQEVQWVVQWSVVWTSGLSSPWARCWTPHCSQRHSHWWRVCVNEHWTRRWAFRQLVKPLCHWCMTVCELLNVRMRCQNPS